MDCALLGLSVDSLYAHIGWIRAIHEQFGVAVPFPIIEDPSMAIGRAYGMLDESASDSSAIRASYFIDPDGVIRALTWYPAAVGRSIKEMLRLVAGLQRTAAGDVMTPEGWSPGGNVMLPPSEEASAALSEENADWFCRTRPDHSP